MRAASQNWRRFEPSVRNRFGVSAPTWKLPVWIPNREFFDNFDAMVEDDASWAYQFQREYDQKTKDLDDVHFDIKPPRVATLPGWHMSDEERYDEERAEKTKRVAGKERSRLSRTRPVLGGAKAVAAGCYSATGRGSQEMRKKKKAAEPPTRDLPRPGKQYPGVHGKIVDWAEHVFEEGMMYVRVRFTDKTELCWTLQTAHVLRESDLSDWKTGDCKQLKVYAENEIDWPE